MKIFNVVVGLVTIAGFPAVIFQLGEINAKAEISPQLHWGSSVVQWVGDNEFSETLNLSLGVKNQGDYSPREWWVAVAWDDRIKFEQLRIGAYEPLGKCRVDKIHRSDFLPRQNSSAIFYQNGTEIPDFEHIAPGNIFSLNKSIQNSKQPIMIVFTGGERALPQGVGVFLKKKRNGSFKIEEREIKNVRENLEKLPCFSK